MADFTDMQAQAADAPLVLLASSPRLTSTSMLVPADAGSAPPEPAEPVVVRQRIWDLTLGAWVYYALPEITASPLASATTPNHSGNLKQASHEAFKAKA